MRMHVFLTALALVALLGFAVTALVHVCSFFGLSLLAPRDGLLPLFYCVVLVYVPMFCLAIVQRLKGRSLRFDRRWTGMLLVLFVYSFASAYLIRRDLGVETARFSYPLAFDQPERQIVEIRAVTGYLMLFYFFNLAYFAHRIKEESPQ
jgi:hypothetical protein